ncbi:MAG: hypothetical protein WCC17_22695 [Candidatus Nitrosopolaris sp.]
MTLQSQIDRCEVNEHSFDYVGYLPDFEQKRYILQFRCEYCGVEVADNVRMKEDAEGRL